LFKSTDGMALVMFSAQNIDRLVTLYRAALRSDRDFVMDLYTASIALATGNPNIPHPADDWPHVRVYVPRWQRVKVKEASAFQRVEQIKPYRLFEEQLAVEPRRYVTKFDASSAPKLAQAGCLSGARAVWSMWAGYLSEPSGARLQSLLQRSSIPLVVEHTSGHASLADLRRLAKALDPGSIVPIHSFGGHRFSQFFDRVTAKNDGEWWEV
jgi:ribonuclease J